jgi:hypothetical protein
VTNGEFVELWNSQLAELRTSAADLLRAVEKLAQSGEARRGLHVPFYRSAPGLPRIHGRRG